MTYMVMMSYKLQPSWIGDSTSKRRLAYVALGILTIFAKMSMKSVQYAWFNNYRERYVDIISFYNFSGKWTSDSVFSMAKKLGIKYVLPRIPDRVTKYGLVTRLVFLKSSNW